MTTSATYRKCDSCGMDCDWLFMKKEDEPCWGQVIPVDEQHNEDDHWWIHACEGHAGKYDGDEYKREPTKATEQ